MRLMQQLQRKLHVHTVVGSLKLLNWIGSQKCLHSCLSRYTSTNLHFKPESAFQIVMQAIVYMQPEKQILNQIKCPTL